MIEQKNINEEMLTRLRSELKTKMSAFRFAHTLGVEEMAARIGAIYCPEKVNKLRAAALLHDITKELSVEAQKEVFKKHGVVMSRETELAPPIHHAITASLEIPERYPDFADPEILSAVKYHTTGRADMTLCEKIIYISDYIDFTRTYSDCILLRDMFWGAHPESMSKDERLMHLDRVVLKSLELTIIDLNERNRTVTGETVEALDFLQDEIKKKEEI